MNALPEPPVASSADQEPILDRLLQSVSPSRLALFQSCRLRFFFRHVLGLQKPKTPALHVGIAVHAVLKAWNRARWQGQSSAIGSLYATYSDAWFEGRVDEPVAWDTPAEETEQKQVGWRLLETFFRETTLRSSDRPEGVEVSVEADLSSHGLPKLVGVLDLVQDGRIIDFKTSASTPHPERTTLINATQTTA